MGMLEIWLSRENNHPSLGVWSFLWCKYSHPIISTFLVFSNPTILEYLIIGLCDNRSSSTPLLMCMPPYYNTHLQGSGLPYAQDSPCCLVFWNVLCARDRLTEEFGKFFVAIFRLLIFYLKVWFAYIVLFIMLDYLLKIYLLSDNSKTNRLIVI